MSWAQEFRGPPRSLKRWFPGPGVGEEMAWGEEYPRSPAQGAWGPGPGPAEAERLETRPLPEWRGAAAWREAEEELEGSSRRRAPHPPWGWDEGGPWELPEMPRSPSPNGRQWRRRSSSPGGEARLWGPPRQWEGSPPKEDRWEYMEARSRRSLRGGSPFSGAGGLEGSRRRRDRWGSPSEEGRDLFPADTDFDLWDSPERRGGEMAWERPKRRRAHSPSAKNRGWGHPQREPRGEHSGSQRQPRPKPFQANRGRGRWRGRGGRRGPEPSPNGSRRQKSPTGSQRSRDRPRQERSGSQRSSQSPPVEKESQGDSGGDSRGSPERADGTQSSNGDQQNWGDSTEPAAGPEEGGEEPGLSEHGGEEGEALDRGSRERSIPLSDEASGSHAADPLAARKEWTPCEAAVECWMKSRHILGKKLRTQYLSACPRPTLPDHSSETPRINTDILNLLSKQQLNKVASANNALNRLQDEVLELLAPALTIYEMAEEAIEGEQPMDPMELREWARCLVKYIGSINHRLTMQRRCQVLGSIAPRLKMVANKLSSHTTNGLLFAEDKVKLLKEILKRFPQLMAPKPFQPMRKYIPPARRGPNTAYYFQGQRQRPPWRASRNRGGGYGSRGWSAAPHPAEQSRP